MRTTREGHSPSDETLKEVLGVAEALSGAREGEVFNTMAKYEASASEIVKVGNRDFTMSFVPENFEAMSDRAGERVSVS
jgi:hypothetical protein